MDSREDSPGPEQSADVAGEPIVASVVSEPPPMPGRPMGAYSGQGPVPPWPQKTEVPQPPVTWREPLAALALVVLADLTIYRGHGWTGYAWLFVAAPLLLCLGTARARFGRAFWIIAAMLVVLAAKMVWCVPWLGWLMLVTCRCRASRPTCWPWCCSPRRRFARATSG